MKKRILALVLSVCILICVLAGCGGAPGSTPSSGSAASVGTASTGTDNQGPLAQLEVYAVSFGANNDDLQKVNDAINDYIRPLINAEVHLNILSFSSYLNQVNLLMAGTDPVDLLMSAGGLTRTLANQGALRPLDDLLAQYGSGIADTFDSQVMDAGRLNGQLYAVPTNRDMARSVVYFYSQEMNEKYDLGLENATNLEELEACFAKLKEVAPDITPITGSNAATSAPTNLFNWEQLSSNYAVLLYDETDELTAANLYESQTYRDFVDRMRRWYQSGYIYEEIDTSTVSGVDLFNTGKYLGYIANGNPTADYNQSQTMGTPMASVELVPPYMSTATVQTATWTIPHNSQNPEVAMKFLNLMYTDPTLVNLLCYGIEGEHYVVTDAAEDIIDYPEGITASTKKYDNSLAWTWGNMLIGHRWNGDVPHQEMIDFNEGAIHSKALGFVFDSAAVQNEITACSNVVARYAVGLEWGKLDPETVLPEFQKELHDAGIDTIITEAQTQLDAWAESNAA